MADIIDELKGKEGIDSSIIEVVRQGKLILMRETEKIGGEEKATHFLALEEKGLPLRDYISEMPKIERKRK